MRLIDADKALSKVKPYEASDENWSVTGGTAIRMIHSTVENAPTIDIGRMAIKLGYEQVVHCKDCKHFDRCEFDCKGFKICPASGMDVTPDDYCSYGEYKRNTEGIK